MQTRLVVCLPVCLLGSCSERELTVASGLHPMPVIPSCAAKKQNATAITCTPLIHAQMNTTTKIPLPIVSLAYQVMEKLDASGCFCCLVVFLLPESSGQASNYVRAGYLMGPLDVSGVGILQTSQAKVKLQSSAYQPGVYQNGS